MLGCLHCTLLLFFFFSLLLLLFPKLSVGFFISAIFKPWELCLLFWLVVGMKFSPPHGGMVCPLGVRGRFPRLSAYVYPCTEADRGLGIGWGLKAVSCIGISWKLVSAYVGPEDSRNCNSRKSSGDAVASGPSLISAVRQLTGRATAGVEGALGKEDSHHLPSVRKGFRALSSHPLVEVWCLMSCRPATCCTGGAGGSGH